MNRRLFLGMTALAGCRRNFSRIIGVVPKGANHIFWQTVRAGAIKAARETNYAIEWKAPALEIDSSRQIEIVESMVNRRLAGIVLAPVDKRALVSVVERAHGVKIPVAIFDSAIDTDKRISYVATNNEEGGRMAARRLGELLGGKGKVALIGFMAGSAATMEREAGFQNELKRTFPRIQMVGLYFSMADRAKALAATGNVLAAHPGLAGLFADNESSSAGAVQALKSHRAKHVRMVAFDASEQLVQDCRDGWIDSLIVQNPFKMGYESTRAVTMHHAGQAPPAHIDCGARLITRAQLEEPEVKAYLFPEIESYLKGG